MTGKAGSQVDILVENMGRVNYGKQINDFKVCLCATTCRADVCPLDILVFVCSDVEIGHFCKNCPEVHVGVFFWFFRVSSIRDQISKHYN